MLRVQTQGITSDQYSGSRLGKDAHHSPPQLLFFLPFSGLEKGTEQKGGGEKNTVVGYRETRKKQEIGEAGTSPGKGGTVLSTPSPLPGLGAALCGPSVCSFHFPDVQLAVMNDANSRLIF